METIDLYSYIHAPEQAFLTEGLLRTIDISKTQKLLYSFAKSHDIFLHIEEIKWSMSDPTKTNSLKVTLHLDSEDVYSAFLQLANNLGWFPSYTYTTHQKYKDQIAKNLITTTGGIEFALEAKFDIEVSLDDDIIKDNKLYHVTTAPHIPKIKKIGLVPKARTKIAVHPERVYLALTEKYAFDMATMFARIDPSTDLVLLTIDTTKLPNYFKIYSDPNYVKMGVYTMHNIPPIAITEYRQLQ